MTALLYRLGRACVRYRHLVVAAWVLTAIVITVGSRMGGGDMSDQFRIPGVESQRALDVLEARFPAAAGTSARLGFATRAGSATDAPSNTMQRALADVARQPGVLAVSPLQRPADGRI